MNIFMTYIHILARDEDGWINIIFVVGMVLFWVIGGLLKAKTQKDKNQEEEQPVTRRVFGTAEETEHAGDLSKGTAKPAQSGGLGIERQRGKPLFRGPGGQRHIAQTMRKVDRPVAPEEFMAAGQQGSQRIKAMKDQKLRITDSLKDMDVKKQLGDIVEGVARDVDFKIPKLELTSKKQDAIEKLLLDFKAKDSLRSAILYYEILGKPLALREAENQLWN